MNVPGSLAAMIALANREPREASSKILAFVEIVAVSPSHTGFDAVFVQSTRIISLGAGFF